MPGHVVPRYNTYSKDHSPHVILFPSPLFCAPTTILGAATASSTVKQSLRRWPFCSFVCLCVDLFVSCGSVCDLLSFDRHVVPERSSSLQLLTRVSAV